MPGVTINRRGWPDIREKLVVLQDALGYIVPGDEWEIGRNQNKEEKVSLGKSAGQAIETALRKLATQ